MARGYSGFAFAQAVWVAVTVAIGVPAAISAVHEQSLRARVEGATLAERRDPSDDITRRLADETPRSAEERQELAYALLERASDARLPAQQRAIRAARAAEELRIYLAEVPGNGRAWANLAAAELQRGRRNEAAQALKTSILTAPWLSSMVLWRCGLGIDLIRSMDDEGRELLKGQFRIAVHRSARDLARTVAAHNGRYVALMLLASSPDELMQLQDELAK